MNQTADDKKISLKGEILRKLTHIGAFVVPGSYYFFDLSKTEILPPIAAFWVILVFVEIGRFRGWKIWNIARPIMAPMLRKSELESNRFSGAFYILPAMIISILIFQPAVALLALSFIIFGDPASAIIGRRFGKHKFLKNKSWEGSFGFLAVAAIVAVLVPEIPTWIALIGAVSATVAEAMSSLIDDNMTVPIFSGAVVTLLIYLAL